MPKKNLLISAALTAFILVIATGIASAYQRVNGTIEAVKVETSADAARADEVQPVADAAQPDAAQPDAAQPAEQVQVMVTHQEAALVAANHLGQTDLYSVENVLWEGIDAYEVVFSSGESVFISMTGDVLGTEVPEPVVIIEEIGPSSSAAVGGTTNARPSSNTYNDDDDHGGDHDDDHDDDYDDDHDDDDDDDHDDD